MEGGGRNGYGMSRAGGKKKGSSRRKRMHGGEPLGSSPFSMQGGTGQGAPSTASASVDAMPNLGGMQGQLAGLLKEGLGVVTQGKMGGGGHTRRLRKRSGKARHHRTKSYTAGGKKGRKTRRRHRRRHH
jgi:hypothetical protein